MFLHMDILWEKPIEFIATELPFDGFAFPNKIFFCGF